MCTKFEKKNFSVFELSRTQGNFYGGGSATDLNPIYPRLSSGDITRQFKCKMSLEIPLLGESANTDQLQQPIYLKYGIENVLIWAII